MQHGSTEIGTFKIRIISHPSIFGKVWTRSEFFGEKVRRPSLASEQGIRFLIARSYLESYIFSKLNKNEDLVQNGLGGQFWSQCELPFSTGERHSFRVRVGAVGGRAVRNLDHDK